MREASRDFQLLVAYYSYRMQHCAVYPSMSCIESENPVHNHCFIELLLAMNTALRGMGYLKCGIRFNTTQSFDFARAIFAVIPAST